MPTSSGSRPKGLPEKHWKSKKFRNHCNLKAILEMIVIIVIWKANSEHSSATSKPESKGTNENDHKKLITPKCLGRSVWRRDKQTRISISLPQRIGQAGPLNAKSNADLSLPIGGPSPQAHNYSFVPNSLSYRIHFQASSDSSSSGRSRKTPFDEQVKHALDHKHTPKKGHDQLGGGLLKNSR